MTNFKAKRSIVFMLVIIFILVSLLLSANYDKNINTDNEDNSSIDEPSETYYKTSENNEEESIYDGAYNYFVQLTRNDGYIYYSLGQLKISGKNCTLHNALVVDEKSSESREYDGICMLDTNGSYYIKLNNSKIIYECSLNNKNIICNLITEEGISGTNYNEKYINFDYYLSLKDFYRHDIYYSNYILNPNLKWKMNHKLVEQIVDGGFYREENNISIIYKEYFFGDLENCAYGFDLDSLTSYMCNFKKDISKSYDKYKTVKESISIIYGEPAYEKYLWTNEEYKDSEEKYNAAIEYGYLSIDTRWNLEDFYIQIQWDYDKGMNIMYILNGYE